METEIHSSDSENKEDKLDSASNSDRCASVAGLVQRRIARKLHRVAELVSRSIGASSASGGVSQIGSQTSAWIHGKADRIEHLDPEKIKKDFTASVQRNPGSSLLIAAAAGLVLGVIVRRR